MTFARTVVDDLLGDIEARELVSLRWGYVDGSLTAGQLQELAADVLARHDAPGTAPDLVRELLALRLLLAVRSPDDDRRYRSRFAEGMRLLTRNRLLVPWRSWFAEEDLIADYRVDARPRRVPRRDIPQGQAAPRIAPTDDSLERRLTDALLRSDSRATHLSQFQVEAAEALRGGANADQTNRGMVISAGTGSGKTRAFYIPAYVMMGRWIEQGKPWVKALAIYPRRELLKDQFGEAFRLARAVDGVLLADGRRPITIGTFFGLTPERAQTQAIERAGWLAAGGGAFICPFLSCPRCQRELVWLPADIDQESERLVCRNAPRCPSVVTDEQVILTRRRAQTQPADVMFTTVEMLNQRLSDTWNRGVLGIGARTEQSARIVLMDEVHTYEGVSGAQSALVLRRWRQAARRPVRFVGLSATLREAPAFFAQLTGLPVEAVTEISPRDEDMEPVGMAYQVVLRANPAARRSLLSATIQTSFLLERLLDPAPTAPTREDGPFSDARFGHRTFVFTDDLDVTNRLFDNLRDAEAHNIFGRPDPTRAPYAGLRHERQPDSLARDLAGQSWKTCSEIGWDLNGRLRVTRTTSQDAGVSAASDLVVATAALEVGFDDPTVGAVVQHKSPYRMAAFVQRKGRAGRDTRMRPWMVTVLSDYGRDRMTYQSYEQLFDPALAPQSLPIRNGYVLRMQAVFAFLDWLAVEAQTHGDRAWWWRTVNGPNPNPNEWDRKQQRWLQETLRSLMRGDVSLNTRLAAHLRDALLISETEVASLLWEPPRSLMLEMIPTLARRLATQWELAFPVGTANLDLPAMGYRVHPLPDFVPSNLFSDLSLPEVSVIVPPATVNAAERIETLPIGAALRHLPPGRITRRFAHERGKLNHWSPVELQPADQQLPVSRFAERYDFVRTVSVVTEAGVIQVPCFRPWTIRLHRIPETVLSPSSNARLNWQTEIESAGRSHDVPVDDLPGWGEIVRALTFHVHGYRASVSVRRFAASSTATLRLPDKSERVVNAQFTTDDGAPAAVGFEQDVDGMAVQVRLPAPEELALRAATAASMPAWRAACFRERVLVDPNLAAETSWFDRGWLHQVYLAALLHEAWVGNIDLRQAACQLREAGPGAFDTILTPLLGIAAEGDDLTDVTEATDRELEQGAGGASREAPLRELLTRTSIRDRLDVLAADLWTDSEAWTAWLSASARRALGDAILLACMTVAPRHAALDTLLLDDTADGSSATAPLWITESTLGGAGVIESILVAVAADRRTLFTALDAALAPGDLEDASAGLDDVVALLQTDAAVAEAAAQVRAAHRHDEREQAQQLLLALLARRGIGVGHALASAMNHRLLREGCTPAGDQLLADLLERWTSFERRIGVSVDLRIFCGLAVTDPVLGPRIAAWIGRFIGVVPDQADAAGALAGLLWPRPAEIRPRATESYNPYRASGYADIGLVRELLLRDEQREVWWGSVGWLEQVKQILARHGVVRVLAQRAEEDQLQRDLFQVLATPVDVDYLQFFPSIERGSRDTETVRVTLVLREMATS